MSKKKGIADRAIFILGLTLAGVIAFVIIAGVIVAVLKYYMEREDQATARLKISGKNEEMEQLETIESIEQSVIDNDATHPN